MAVLRHAENRRSETPNAIMTTLASPGQGGAELSVWRVDMQPGAAGPPHSFDVEQVWAMLDGAATVELDGETHRVARGDAVVMPAGVPRQVTADQHAGCAAIVAATAGGHAFHAGKDEPITPPWIS